MHKFEPWLALLALPGLRKDNLSQMEMFCYPNTVTSRLDYSIHAVMHVWIIQLTSLVQSTLNG